MFEQNRLDLYIELRQIIYSYEMFKIALIFVCLQAKNIKNRSVISTRNSDSLLLPASTYNEYLEKSQEDYAQTYPLKLFQNLIKSIFDNTKQESNHTFLKK